MKTITNNQKQASARIRFALWRASRKAGCPTDYREMNLTQEQAVELLEKFNKETGYSNGRKYKHSDKFLKEQSKEEMYKEKFIAFFKEKYLDEAISRLNSVLDKPSEVYEVDALGNDLGGKRYRMYGCCAIGWLEFRKCKKYELIYNVARGAFNHECRDLIHASIDKKIVKRLEQEGCPISAITSQDYSFQEMENDCIAEFLELNGAKNVRKVVHID